MEMAAITNASCRETQKAGTTTHEVVSLGVMSPKPMVEARDARNRIAFVIRPEFFFLYGRKVRLRRCIC